MVHHIQGFEADCVEGDPYHWHVRAHQSNSAPLASLSIFPLADVAGLQVKIYDFFGDSTVAKDLADLTEQQGVVRLRFHHGAHACACVRVCVCGPCNLHAPAGSCLGVLPLHDRVPAQASHRPRLVPSLCAEEHWRRRVHGRDGAARPLHLPRVESKCVVPFALRHFNDLQDLCLSWALADVCRT